MMSRRAQILALGEVLWDIFPDGPRFGGAPANFACACAELGGDTTEVALMSAVGNDSLGHEARNHLQRHQVQTQFLVESPYPTGQVFVTLDEGRQASYRFLEQCAWDFIPYRGELETAAQQAEVIYFGTLGQRAAVSAQTIRRLVTASRGLRVCDLNLRPPYDTPEAISFSLESADVLKLNEEELARVARDLELRGDADHILKQLQSRYRYRLIAFTLGAQGSILISQEGQRSEHSAVPVKIVDTVGAGDAFTAAMVLGLLRGDSLEALHDYASQVAAYVCTHAGGTPHFSEFTYRHSS